MTWKDKVYVLVTIFLFIGGFAVTSALETSGVDPLAFWRLTWYCTVCCLGISALIVRISLFHSYVRLYLPALRPLSQVTVFSVALCYVLGPVLSSLGMG